MPKISRISLLAIATGVALAACQTGSAKEAQQQASNSPTCSAASACGAGSYCRMDAPGQTGVCTPKPQTCPMIYVAVCGTDAKTYPNECHAAQAGVNVAHQGACTK